MPPRSGVGLSLFQRLLSGGQVDAESFSADPILDRVRQILDERRAGRMPGHADLATLLRHAIMARSTRGQRHSLRVHKSDGWPAANEWSRFGLAATDLDSDLLLTTVDWQPEWLGSGAIQDEDVFAEVFRGQQVRISAETPIDPCVGEVTGYDHYSCPGQREAIRSLLHMPAGSTLVVNLPTGSGKTLVGQLPPLLHGLNGGLTLFVVPTTALAIDKDRRMRQILAQRSPPTHTHDFAWFAELSEAAKTAIKQRIRTGTQGILFASPEAATGALLPALPPGSVSVLIDEEGQEVTRAQFRLPRHTRSSIPASVN